MPATMRPDSKREPFPKHYPRKEDAMASIDIGSLPVTERLPGWRGRYFHSETMTVAHYDFDRGATIHEHFHPQEEIYEVLDGELELTLEGVSHRARPGVAVVVPAGVRHSVTALTDGKAIIVDCPRRPEMR
jgi:quercetin dioxygenase-like cupin family protein